MRYRKSSFRTALAVAVLLLFVGSVIPTLCVQSSPAQVKKLKVYISVDMEGVAGAVTADQLVPSGYEYERFRRFMTDEAMAAVRAAKSAGASDIVIADSHHEGENLLIELFPTDVSIVRGMPRHGGVVPGLDSTFDAALLVGFHASTSNPHGVRAHTFSSAHFTRVALNGSNVTEGEFAAAYAGFLGVPVVFASGDDAAMQELRARLGNIETVETKKSLGFHSAQTLTPEASCERISSGVQYALSHLQSFKPYVIKAPVTLEISLKSYTAAEMLTYLHAVRRVDSHTIQFVGKDMAEVSDFVDFLEGYNPDMVP